MENRSLISIVIPAYNSEKYLKDCLLSVQQQTYTNWECIVVDDGSEDATLAVAQAMAAMDSRFMIIHGTHDGVSHARNQGLALASGEFVTFLDSDDRYTSNFLEQALQKIGNADLFIAGIKNILVDAAGTEFELEAWTIPELHFANGKAFAEYYLREHKLLLYANCNKLYRRNILVNKHILFDEELDFGEDRVFNYTYFQYIKEAVTTEDCFYYYYHRDNGSLSTKFRKFHMQELLHLHQEKMYWLINVLGETFEEELARFEEYDVTKEYHNAQVMLNQYKAVLSEETLQAEYKVLDSVRDLYSFLKKSAGSKL